MLATLLAGTLFAAEPSSHPPHRSALIAALIKWANEPPDQVATVGDAERLAQRKVVVYHGHLAAGAAISLGLDVSDNVPSSSLTRVAWAHGVCCEYARYVHVADYAGEQVVILILRTHTRIDLFLLSSAGELRKAVHADAAGDMDSQQHILAERVMTMSEGSEALRQELDFWRGQLGKGTHRSQSD